MRKALHNFFLVGILASVFWTGLAAPVLADSVARSLTRDQIRSMPILERPNRFGHFYGNTVRRRHYRHHSDSYSSAPSPHRGSRAVATSG